MSAEFLAMVAAGAIAGGFVNGLAGFGTSLFALGWWLQVMPPVQAVAIALLMSVASGIQGVVVVRHAIDLKILGVFLIPALAGIPIGLSILHRIDADLLEIIIAAFLLAYGGFFMFRRDLPSFDRATPWADGTIGFVSGILGAIAGLSGALPTMWLAMRPWTKQQSRAVLQPFNVVVLGVSATMLAFAGSFDRETLLIALIVLPVSILAAQFGLFSFRRLEDLQFRRLLVVLMFVSGSIMVLRELV